jgi:hypothetical protein
LLTFIQTSTICYGEERDVVTPLKGPLNLEGGPKLGGIKDTIITPNIAEIELSQNGKSLEDFLSKGLGTSEKVKIHIYELSSPSPYWLDYMSSMGSDSRKILMDWVGNSIIANSRENEGDVYFEEHASLLKGFLGGAPKKELIEGAKLIADFIGELLTPYESTASIDRPFYSTSFKLCPFSHRSISIILVDPTPHSGPENLSYLIVIDSIYAE